MQSASGNYNVFTEKFLRNGVLNWGKSQTFRAKCFRWWGIVQRNNMTFCKIRLFLGTGFLSSATFSSTVYHTIFFFWCLDSFSNISGLLDSTKHKWWQWPNLELTCKNLDFYLENWPRFQDLKIWWNWDFMSPWCTKIAITRSILKLQDSSFACKPDFIFHFGS